MHNIVSINNTFDMMTYIVGVKPFKGVQDFLFQCFYLSIKDPNGCVAKILLNV